MTESGERAEAEKLAQELLRIDYAPEKPTPRQAEFLLYFGLEAMYGGAAGGGKSSALLMGALQFVEIPQYSALILRKTFSDLTQPGALIDRSKQWLSNSDATWSEKRHAWIFPSGAVIQFGYLEHENQRYRYQSAEFQYIAFDELTQFPETSYRYLFSRLRRPQDAKGALAKVPLRMRSASNPGGAGHEWVKSRFIDSRDPKTMFFPAKLADNPFVDQEAYIDSLRMLDSVTLAQMLDGDWTVSLSGGYFSRGWFKPAEMIPESEVYARVRYIDLAASEPDELGVTDPDWTVFLRMALLRNGTYVVEDVKRFQATPATIEMYAREIANGDPSNTEFYVEQEPGAAGKMAVSHWRRNVLRNKVVRAFPRRKEKEMYAKPVSARAQQGDILFSRGEWNNAFFDECEVFPHGAHDDQVDAFTGAFHVLSSGLVAPSVAPVGMFSKSAWRM